MKLRPDHRRKVGEATLGGLGRSDALAVGWLNSG